VLIILKITRSGDKEMTSLLAFSVLLNAPNQRPQFRKPPPYKNWNRLVYMHSGRVCTKGRRVLILRGYESRKRKRTYLLAFSMALISRDQRSCCWNLCRNDMRFPVVDDRPSRQSFGKAVSHINGLLHVEVRRRKKAQATAAGWTLTVNQYRIWLAWSGQKDNTTEVASLHLSRWLHTLVVMYW